MLHLPIYVVSVVNIRLRKLCILQLTTMKI
nr:MAG TPA: hypothetical protein [Caudoviricetes sp.]